MSNKFKQTLINKKILISIITLIILLAGFFFAYHFLLQPKSTVNRVYKSPENTLLLNLNQQVVKSLDYKEFKKDLKIKVIKRNWKETTILATYPAPNYLDSANALVADTFKLKNKFLSWEIIEVKSTYLENGDDRTKTEENLQNLLEQGNGIDRADEQRIIDQNSEILDDLQANSADLNSTVTSDGKLTFNYLESAEGSKLQIQGSNKTPTISNAIYGHWHDDNKTLVFIDNETKNNSDSYKLGIFNAETGEQKTLLSREGWTGILGFISKGNFVAYTSYTDIGVINLTTGEVKSVHSFPPVGLNSDEPYIPDLRLYDDQYFLAEIFDPEYTLNKKVTAWRIAWDGSSVEKSDEYVAQ